jgi:DivIVA domain-containing protein
VIGADRTEPEEPVSDTPEHGADSHDSGRVPAEIRDVSFAVSLRGYDRDAVDDYVARVKNLISELEAARSPEAAVRHALEQVAEQTSRVLESAGKTAEEIGLNARRQAEETTASAESKAAEIRAQAQKESEELLGRSKTEAETLLSQARTEAAEERQRAEEEISARWREAEERMHRLRSDTDSVRDERRKLVEDVREIAARVEAAANDADERYPPQQRGKARAEAVPDTRATEVAESSEAADDGHNQR